MLGFCEPNTVEFFEFLEELVSYWLLTKEPTSLSFREVFRSVHFRIASKQYSIYLVNNTIYI